MGGDRRRALFVSRTPGCLNRAAFVNAYASRIHGAANGNLVASAAGTATADDYVKALEKVKPDVVVFWGYALLNYLQSGEPFVFDDAGIPYVSIWDDNPLRYLYHLRPLKNHAALLVIDSMVVEQLHALGV